jgi:hypothetical protein
VVWRDNKRTPIAGLDSAYGGDRCIEGWAEMGIDVRGVQVLNFNPMVDIQQKVIEGKSEEEQIAEFSKDYCESSNRNVPPDNFFHDATGRGSLGTVLSRVWSTATNPVEFGGPPTDRPVSLDLIIYDPKIRQRRLKKCSEHYFNFVSELWYSMRFAIEAGQIRGLPEDVAEEFAMRKWELVNGKIQIEPKSGTKTKPGMKQRVGRSPDLADCAVIILEGARRRGFQISKLGSDTGDEKDYRWKQTLMDRQKKTRESHDLNYAA